MVVNPRVLQVAIAAATLALAQAAYAQVYKWVDEKGVVNYSSTPPEKRKSTRLDEESGRLSTVESYNYARNLPSPRERALQDRVDRFEQEAARNRQTAAQQEAAAQQAQLQWREACIAQRRVDCDDPYATPYDQGFVPYPVVRPGQSLPSRPAPGTYRPTPDFAVGGGGVVGPYLRPPRSGVVVGPGPTGSARDSTPRRLGASYSGRGRAASALRITPCRKRTPRAR
jgi:hypothetical protein